MSILLMVIMVVILIVIRGYSINGYWLLFYK
jgi:hypothetical protein